MALVYAHIRLDIDEIFYIGVELDSPKKKSSKGYRAKVTQNRSVLWNRVVNKAGYKIEILEEELSNEEALLLEQMLIKKYGRYDKNEGLLVNHTDGGDGIVGFRHSGETKEKQRRSALKRGISEETKKKMLEARRRSGYKSDHCSKKVINIKTKEIYKSVKALSNSIDVNLSTITNKLNGHRFNDTDYVYLDKYTPDYKKPVKIKKLSKHCKKVIDISTGKIYLSIVELSKDVGVKPTTLTRSLKGLNKRKENIYKYYNK